MPSISEPVLDGVELLALERQSVGDGLQRGMACLFEDEEDRRSMPSLQTASDLTNPDIRWEESHGE